MTAAALFFDAVVFDLDGTLVDSAPDIAEAVNKTLADRGLRRLPIARVESLIGCGSRDLVARALESSHARPSPEDLDAALADYLAHYRASPAALARLYPGVCDALEALRARGLSLGVCTNKHEDLAKTVLEALGLSDYFRSIVGGDRLPWRKPDPRHLRAVAEELGAPPERVVYVGDSEIDRQCARAAGVRAFIVNDRNRAEILGGLPDIVAGTK